MANDVLADVLARAIGCLILGASVSAALILLSEYDLPDNWQHVVTILSVPQLAFGSRAVLVVGSVVYGAIFFAGTVVLRLVNELRHRRS